MWNEIRFAFYAVKMNVASSAELRTSFLMNIGGMAVNNTAFIFLWVYFVKSVGEVNGWTMADIIGLQGFTALCYGVVFSVAMGMRKLPDYVSSGIFDRFMLSPKNVLVRTATSAFGASAVGDIVFGIVCLATYATLIDATLLQVLLIVTLAAFTTLMFFAAIVIVFSTSFIFVDSYNVSNSLFEIFFSPALFHGGAFHGVVRFVYTFLIPSLLIGTLPVETVRDVSFSTLGLITILTCAWLAGSIAVFHKAVRRYESSNFMTFGG